MSETKSIGTHAWKIALATPRFRTHFGFTLMFLIICGISTPPLFRYIEQRPGFTINDPLLNILQPTEVSIVVFTLLYTFIILGITQLIKKPAELLVGIQAYLIITVTRFITLLLVPLEAPEGILILKDTFVDTLFYQQPVTKDLFFSGHTATVSLFIFLLYERKGLRYAFSLATLTLGILLLFQHAHYTVDVLVAPVVAWGGVRLSLSITKSTGLYPKP